MKGIIIATCMIANSQVFADDLPAAGEFGSNSVVDPWQNTKIDPNIAKSNHYIIEKKECNRLPTSLGVLMCRWDIN